MDDGGRVAELAARLNLPEFARHEELARPGATFGENLLALMEAESARRDERLFQLRLRAAGFPVLKTLDTFRFTGGLPRLDKGAVDRLAGCGFVEERANVCMIGNSGTGKTHLMTAIAYEAVRKGHTARFVRAADLAVELGDAAQAGRLSKLLKKYNRYAVLCIDDWGYVSIDLPRAQLVFQVLAGRYEAKSTMVTSNLPFKEWPKFIGGDEVLATAMVSRLVDRSDVLDMNGESYRTVGRA